LEHNRAHDLFDSVKAIRDHHKQCKGDDLSGFGYLDVINNCEHLKNNKACGHDKIAFEHLKYGGRLLLRHLHHLFNMCLQCGYVPCEWKRSIIIPLFKGGNKSRTDTNSYRGISLVPSIAKVLEKLIEIELSKLRTDSPNRQQVACKKCLSSINTAFNLQEVKIHHIEKNGTIIIINKGNNNITELRTI
jgi:hypothetical protein